MKVVTVLGILYIAFVWGTSASKPADSSEKMIQAISRQVNHVFMNPPDSYSKTVMKAVARQISSYLSRSVGGSGEMDINTVLRQKNEAECRLKTITATCFDYGMLFADNWCTSQPRSAWGTERTAYLTNCRNATGISPTSIDFEKMKCTALGWVKGYDAICGANGGHPVTPTPSPAR